MAAVTVAVGRVRGGVTEVTPAKPYDYGYWCASNGYKPEPFYWYSRRDDQASYLAGYEAAGSGVHDETLERCWACFQWAADEIDCEPGTDWRI